MQDFIQYILLHLSNLGDIGYLLFFLIIILESIVLLGYFIPGTTIAIIFGAMGGYDIGDILFFAILGNIIGNFISYFIGRKIGKKALKNGFFFIKSNYIKKAADFFNKNGGKSIFFGKCIPGIKENISFIAGIFKLNIYKYILWNVIGAIVWGVLFVGLGYIFSSSIYLAYIWAGRVGYIMGILFILILIIIFFRMYFIKFGKYIIYSFKELFFYLFKKININKSYKIFGGKKNILFIFIINRLNKNNFNGLALTILVFILFYLVAGFDGIIEATFNNSIMYNIDMSIENLLYSFRSDIFTKIFLFITYFGNSIFIVIITIFISISLYIKNKKSLILGLLSSVGITILVVNITKNILQRPRPELSIYNEFSYSFPSFHSSISIAFYSFIIWLFFRKIKKFDIRVNLILLSIIIAFIIGFSRLYLDVHYFSDIIGGYIVGLIGLFFGITIVGFIEAKKLFNNKKQFDINLSRKIIFIITFIIIIGLHNNYYINNIVFDDDKKYSKIINIYNIQKFFNIKDNNYLKYTSTITGRKTEPVNFIFLVKKDQDLLNIFNKSGFTPADKISLNSIKRMGTSLYDNIAYNDAPILPLYWNTNIQDFGFQKVDNPKNIRFRHHIRIWKTNFIYKGYNIFVGCGVYDNGLKWHVTHKISPNIDKERLYIYNQLKKSGLIYSSELIQFVKGFIGKNFSGDQFFTDGKTYLLKIK